MPPTLIGVFWSPPWGCWPSVDTSGLAEGCPPPCSTVALPCPALCRSSVSQPPCSISSTFLHLEKKLIKKVV